MGERYRSGEPRAPGIRLLDASRAAATLVALAAVVALMGACGDDDGTGPDSGVASIVVTASSTTLSAIDATVQATATAQDANGDPVSGVTFSWTSSHQSVATVDASGLVTAVGNGTTEITATASGTSGSLLVTVEQEVTTIAFTAAPGNGSVGEALEPQVQVELRDANDNPATEATVTIAIGSNPTGAALLGTITRDAVAGVATFPGLMIDRPGAGFTLEVTTDGLSVETDPFNLTLPSVYVTDFAANVHVIDRSDNTVAASPAVTSARDVAITPDGLFAYTANFDVNTSSVIATTTNTVVETITVETEPLFVEITPDGKEAWVVNFGDGSISVIETASNTVSNTISGLEQRALGLGFTPDGTTAYVPVWTPQALDSVVVIDVATATVTTRVEVGSTPYGLDVTPDGEFVYVANSSSATVSVIATATNTLVATVTVGPTPRQLAVTPDGAFVYVTHIDSDDVKVIDTSTNTVVATIAVGDIPVGVEVTPDGAFVYVGNFNAGTVSVIDTSTNTVVETIPTGGRPSGIAIMPAPIP